MPSPRRDIVSRSESLKRWPTATLSAKTGCAPSGSPPHICAKAFQVSSHACSGHSPQPSSTRPPRANHPIAGAVSPRNIRPDPISTAFRAARRGSSAPDGLVVSARPRERGFLVMAGQVRGERELLEVVEIERRSCIRRRELRVRVAPRAFGE